MPSLFDCKHFGMPPAFLIRIQYCSQEIVVIREDLVNKMCRNCVRLPSGNLDIPNHVSTLNKLTIFNGEYKSRTTHLSWRIAVGGGLYSRQPPDSYFQNPKIGGLHITKVVIPTQFIQNFDSFQIYCGGIPSQNYENCVAFQIVMDFIFPL